MKFIPSILTATSAVSAHSEITEAVTKLNEQLWPIVLTCIFVYLGLFCPNQVANLVDDHGGDGRFVGWCFSIVCMTIALMISLWRLRTSLFG